MSQDKYIFEGPINQIVLFVPAFRIDACDSKGVPKAVSCNPEKLLRKPAMNVLVRLRKTTIESEGGSRRQVNETFSLPPYFSLEPWVRPWRQPTGRIVRSVDSKLISQL